MERLFYGHEGRPTHKPHEALEVYDLSFSRLLTARWERGEMEPVRMLEIGVDRGGSLQLWHKYFGPDAIIFGIDANPECRQVADAGVEVRIGSQADPGFLNSVVDEMGGLDIVLDDGSHKASHQRISFDCLFPRLSENGLYICEDLQTSYWPAYEGGLRREGTFMELVKSMIDWLHDWYILPREKRRQGFNDQYGFAAGVFGIHVYDGIVVIEKRRKERPFHCAVGKEPGTI